MFDINACVLCGHFAGAINVVFYDTWKGVFCANIAHFATKFGLFDGTWSGLLLCLLMTLFIHVFGAVCLEDEGTIYLLQVIVYHIQ